MIPAGALTALVCLWAVLTVRVGSLAVEHRIRRLYYAPFLMILLGMLGLSLVLDGFRVSFDASGVVALTMITLVMVVYLVMAKSYAKTQLHAFSGLTQRPSGNTFSAKQN